VQVNDQTCTPPTDACQGRCAGRYTSSCTSSTSCPSGLDCLPDVGLNLGSTCAGADSPTCDSSTDCPDGFVCRDVTDGKRCVADLVICSGPAGADCAARPACPPGYAHALVHDCFGTCVPTFHCGCSTNDDCPYPSSCDLIQGRCYIPTIYPGCAVPFDPGPCDGNQAVFAFNAGQCEETSYSGCGGNDNRFATMEECLVACRSTPLSQPCPEGRVAANICLTCGEGGGCALRGDFCAETCEISDDCSTPGHTCHDGVCQVYECN